jgi:hypothetical protein
VVVKELPVLSHARENTEINPAMIAISAIKFLEFIKGWISGNLNI